MAYKALRDRANVTEALLWNSERATHVEKRVAPRLHRRQKVELIEPKSNSGSQVHYWFVFDSSDGPSLFGLTTNRRAPDSGSGDRRPVDLGSSLVVAAWVEGELTKDGAVLAEDSKLGTGDKQGDRASPVLVADVDVAEPAQVANRDLAAGVEPVAADPVLERRGQGGSSFEPGLEGLQGCATVERAMGSLLVVVEPEAVELEQ